jgi:hypothetical protein
MSRDDDAIERIELGELLQHAREVLALYRKHSDEYLRKVESYQFKLGQLDERLGRSQ